MTFLRRRKSKRPTRQVYYFNDRLDSREAGLAFDVAFTVEWSLAASGEPSTLPRLLAGRMVRSVAEPQLAAADVLRLRAAEQDLNSSIASVLPRTWSDLTVHAAIGEVSVTEETRSAAEQRDQERRGLALDELERERVRRRIAFLREEVFIDPATARIFWLLENPHHPNPLAQAAALDDLVNQVVRWHPAKGLMRTAHILHEFISELDESGREYLMQLLPKLLRDYGRHELADSLPTNAASDW